MFSDKPGARERHLMRKFQNKLFADYEVEQDDIIQARKQDAEEANQFLDHFRQLVQQAVDLDTNAEADVILKLKEQLDRAYEQCAGLAGDQTEIKAMIKRLLDSIMQAMWKGVGQDIQAQSRLETEEQARKAHFALLESPLVADLMRPDSPIAKDELVSVLLSESEQNLRMAMQIFLAEQQGMLIKMAYQKLSEQSLDDATRAEARQRLSRMEALMTVVSEASN